MNIKLIARITGHILILESLLLLLPLVVSFLYKESCSKYFIITALITGVTGFLLSRIRPAQKTFYAKEGFVIVASSWIVMSLFGALPFYLSGEIPSYVDALFETISGFTTTGASILTNVEAMSYGLLFWRSFTHWIGGMGVLVLMMIVFSPGENSMHIMRAEMPGPTVLKILPKFKDTAKLLYGMYLFLTIIEIVLLLLGNMPLFDSMIHAFGSAGTGGFSMKNASIAAYNSPYIEWVIGIFILLFGINFNLYYLVLLKNIRKVWKNEELRWYGAIVFLSVAFITINIFSLYDNFSTALRTAFFQVASIITTTGYATADYNIWPQLSRTILVLLMICGACAGSTGGGIKVSRILLLWRSTKRELSRLMHPRCIRVVSMDNKPVEEQTISSIHIFFTLYMVIVGASLILVSFNGFDFESNFTAILACLNNIGPGMNIVGPTGNYSTFSAFSKLILSLNMLLGRLELYPILLLLIPGGWHNRRITYGQRPHLRR